MNLFKTLSVAALVAASTLTASAFEFTLVVPDASQVEGTLNYQPLQLHDGENVLQAEMYYQMKLRGVNPYTIESVTNPSGTPWGYVNDAEWSSYIYPDDAGKVYTVNTINLDEIRTAQFSLTVDDASKVKATLSGYSAELNLVDGENIVKFNPEKEGYLTITNRNNSISLYQVNLDGAKVDPRSSSYWNFAITDGCAVDVMANYPDKDVTLNFSYSEKGMGAIKAVQANGVDVENFDGTTAVVKLGSSITLVGNPDYKLDGFKINGVDSYSWYNIQYPYNYGTVLDDVDFYINAHPYGTYQITVNVNEPEFLNFYTSYSPTAGTKLEITGTTNVLEIPENVNYVNWTIAPGAYVKSITLNGNGLYASQQSTQISAGAVFDFEIEKINLDETVVFWVDNREMINQNFYLRANDSSYTNFGEEIVTGYNVLPYYDGYNTLDFTWNTTNEVVGKVYLNDEVAEPAYPNSNNYRFTLGDLDVVKVFFENEPVECEVAFTVADGVDIEVLRDIVVPVTDLENTFTTFKGTQINVASAEADKKIAVKVNGTEVEANEAGGFQFVVDAENTAVEITAGDATKVATINAANVADGAVYNMHGQKLNGNLNELPAGLYIVNGKKVVR